MKNCESKTFFHVKCGYVYDLSPTLHLLFFYIFLPFLLFRGFLPLILPFLFPALNLQRSCFPVSCYFSYLCCSIPPLSG